jgi:hypothetical protein
MENFLSISAIAAMAIPIIFISTPAQALTWDDVWGAVQKGIIQGVQSGAENAVRQNMTEQPSASNDNSEKPATEQPSDSSNESPPEEAAE